MSALLPVLILVDESSAMSATPDGATQPLAATAATAINALIAQVGAGGDAVMLAVVGYHADHDGMAQVGTRMGGSHAGRDFVPTSELAAAPVRVESRTRKIAGQNPLAPPREEVVSFPVWFEPQTGAKAPQVAAFEYCARLLEQFSGETPPLVLHVTAGGSGDGNPHQAVSSLQSQGRGAVVFHCHMGTNPHAPVTTFPANRGYMPAGLVRDMFDRSSPLTPAMIADLKAAKYIVHAGARGLIHNGKPVHFVDFLGLARAHAKQVEVSFAVSTAAPPAPGTWATTPTAQTGAAPQMAATAPADTFSLLDGSGSDSTAGGPPAADAARLLVIVLDRSVASPFASDGNNAFGRLQERANELLGQIANRSDPNWHVALASYGTDATGAVETRSGWGGPLAGRPIVPAADLASGAIRREEIVEEIPNGAGGLLAIKRERLLFLELEPTAGCSPIGAFHEVGEILQLWASQHPAPAKSPLVLHLTRGAHNADDLRAAVGGIGGSAAVYHWVATESPHVAVAYPDAVSVLDDPGLVALWEASSRLIDADAFAGHPALNPNSRGLVVNGRFDCLLPPS